MGVWRKLIVARASGGVFFPTGKSFIDRLCPLPKRTIRWRKIVSGAINIVGNTDFQFIVFVETIDIGDGEAGDTIDHASEAEQDSIEPATATRTTGCSPEFTTEIVKVFGKSLVTGREWTGTNAGGVSFADADD